MANTPSSRHNAGSSGRWNTVAGSSVVQEAVDFLQGLDSSHRILALHAHPDDEALWSGLALNYCAQKGAQVIVATATLGEQGEIIGKPLEGLDSQHDDSLGGYRFWELAHSLRDLGVNKNAVLEATQATRGVVASLESSPVLLGGVGQWMDSGMAGSTTTERSFVRSGARSRMQLREIIEKFRPDIVLTYNPQGGYGHPDHIECHRVVMDVWAELSKENHPACPRGVLWCETDEERVSEALAEVASVPAPWTFPKEGELAMIPQVDMRLEATDGQVNAKKSAMRDHATQLWLSDEPHPISGHVVKSKYSEGSDGKVSSMNGMFVLSNNIAQPLLTAESYTLGAWRTADGTEPTFHNYWSDNLENTRGGQHNE